MRVRGVIKPRKGSPTTSVDASVTTAPAVSPLGAPAVTAFVKAHDTFDSTVLAMLTLNPTEARELAERLTKHAAEAEALAGAECGK